MSDFDRFQSVRHRKAAELFRQGKTLKEVKSITGTKRGTPFFTDLCEMDSKVKHREALDPQTLADRWG